MKSARGELVLRGQGRAHEDGDDLPVRGVVRLPLKEVRDPVLHVPVGEGAHAQAAHVVQLLGRERAQDVPGPGALDPDARTAVGLADNVRLDAPEPLHPVVNVIDHRERVGRALPGVGGVLRVGPALGLLHGGRLARELAGAGELGLAAEVAVPVHDEPVPEPLRVRVQGHVLLDPLVDPEVPGLALGVADAQLAVHRVPLAPQLALEPALDDRGVVAGALAAPALLQAEVRVPVPLSDQGVGAGALPADVLLAQVGTSGALAALSNAVSEVVGRHDGLRGMGL